MIQSRLPFWAGISWGIMQTVNRNASLDHSRTVIPQQMSESLPGIWLLVLHAPSSLEFDAVIFLVATAVSVSSVQSIVIETSVPMFISRMLTRPVAVAPMLARFVAVLLPVPVTPLHSISTFRSGTIGSGRSIPVSRSASQVG